MSTLCLILLFIVIIFQKYVKYSINTYIFTQRYISMSNQPYRWCDGLECSPRMRSIVCSSSCRVKSKINKLVCVASPVSTQLSGVRAKTGWLGTRIMCPSGATCPPTDCCFSELHVALYNPIGIGLVLSGHPHFIECHLFSPWYSWKTDHLALNNNHSLYE